MSNAFEEEDAWFRSGHLTRKDAARPTSAEEGRDLSRVPDLLYFVDLELAASVTLDIATYQRITQRQVRI